MKTIKLFFISMLVIAFTASCEDDDTPQVIVPSEVITDVELTFTNISNSSDIVTLKAVSADGIVAPTLTTEGTFTANAVYTGAIIIQDNVNNEDILAEVIEEKDEHFFVYDYSGINLVTMERSFADIERTDGNFIGLNTIWEFGGASTGTITLQLVHEPTSVDDQFAETLELGTATGGEFDINVTWDVDIQ